MTCDFVSLHATRTLDRKIKLYNRGVTDINSSESSIKKKMQQ
jgi:hypothetical protein